MEFTVIATLGPSLLSRSELAEIFNFGPVILRINGAHSGAEECKNMVATVRKVNPKAKIMIDLPGNKIRTAGLSEPIRLEKDAFVRIANYQLNFPEFKNYVSQGDIVYANDSIFKLEIVDIEEEGLLLKSFSEGLLHNNKGFHVKGIHSTIPFLFERDQALIQVAQELDVDYLSLSFVRNRNDILEAKKLVKNSNIQLISKIETESALYHLDEIMDEVEILNIDRGDLSAEIGILNLPYAQEMVVEKCLGRKKTIFLATQFMKSMENNPIPYISEVSDLYKTVKLGISGIQLSEEVAIGKYPLKCIELAFDVHRVALHPVLRSTAANAEAFQVN